MLPEETLLETVIPEEAPEDLVREIQEGGQESQEDPEGDLEAHEVGIDGIQPIIDCCSIEKTSPNQIITRKIGHKRRCDPRTTSTNQISVGKISHVYKRTEVMAKEAWRTNHLSSRIFSFYSSIEYEAINYFQRFTTYREELSVNIVSELPADRREVPFSKETTNEAQKERSDQETFRRERGCELKSVAENLNYIEQIEQSLHSEVQGDIQKPRRMKIKNVNFEEWEKFPLWREMRDETWA